MKLKLFSAIFWLINCSILINAGPHEKRLIRDLFRDYEKLERPAANETSAVDVKHSLTLQSILDLDTEEGILNTLVWQSLEWEDHNLKWDPLEYGNVQDIRVPAQYIWLPDIVPYNTIEYRNSDPKQLPTNVVVTSEGLITWIPPMNLRTTCKIDRVNNYQTCHIKFGSWTYDGFLINLKLKSAPEGTNVGEADISSFVVNDDWILVKVPATLDEMFYTCCAEPYQSITYSLHLKKRKTTLGSWLGLD